MNKIKKQGGNQWKDSNGMLVDVKRITLHEKMGEKNAVKTANLALKAEALLVELKTFMRKAAEDGLRAFLKEKGEVFEGMRNYVYYNFDRSVRVVYEVQQEVVFDENQMQLAHDRFKVFVEHNLQENQGFLKDIILSAFKNRKGRFDNKKVNTLLSYRSADGLRDNAEFQAAVATLEEARKVKGVNVYDRVYVLEGGEYRPIQLQFSAIEPETETEDGHEE